MGLPDCACADERRVHGQGLRAHGRELEVIALGRDGGVCQPVPDPCQQQVVAAGRHRAERVEPAQDLAGAAGIPMIAAVGAPSSLAVELAQRFDLTLAGFDAKLNAGVRAVHGLVRLN